MLHGGPLWLVTDQKSVASEKRQPSVRCYAKAGFAEGHTPLPLFV